ncbi:MAG: single-stranded-DNA-specific exonuclease C-terminal domain-containing protein, partial [Paraclostridium sp.]
FDYINKDSLIITNSLNGFYRAISDISLTEYEFDINYNLITSNNNNKVQLIFYPYIDKIDLKRYNNIVLYDYLYNIEEYSYIYEYIGKECEIIKYYDKNDLLYINSIVNNAIPDREEFIKIYKIMLKNSELNVNLTDIKSTLGVRPLKLFTILNVFKELSLLDFYIDDNSNALKMKIMPKPNTKLDLNSSQILQSFYKLRDKYIESY